jgi:DNA repair exonuclease SbcCD ATPase subunit
MPKTIVKYSLLKQFLEDGEKPMPDGDKLQDYVLLDAAGRLQENVENLKQYLDQSSGNKSKIERVAKQAEKLSQIAKDIEGALKSGEDFKRLVRRAYNIFADIWSMIGWLELKKEEFEKARDFVDEIADALRTLAGYAYGEVIESLRREIRERLSRQQPPHTP